jgi:beta-galactosidase
VVVFSNCEEVELRLNGRTIARQKPDDGPDARMGDAHADEDMLTNYMKIGKTVQDFEKMIEERRRQPRKFPLFTGGDCTHLEHAPFTFPLVPYESGVLEAVGYVGGKEAARFVRHTPGAPASLRLKVETLGKPIAQGAADAVFVRAEVVDANGEVVPTNTGNVAFETTGPGTLVSPLQAPVDAGIATALLRTNGSPGPIQIRVSADGLTQAKATLSASQP